MSDLKIPEGKIDVVIDTDAFADSIYEMDDQFAIAYLLAFDKFNVKAFYTFQKSEGFIKGISEVVTRCGRGDLCEKIFKGGEGILNADAPEKTEAVLDLIERSKAYSKDNPLYVIAIGPLTNIGAALLIDPTLSERIVVVALMGHDFEQENTDEYNLAKDMTASKVLIESNTPLMLVPCINVAKKLVMSSEECMEWWQGKSNIGDYLIYCLSLLCSKEYFPKLKRIVWDAVPVVLLAKPELVTAEIRERPMLTDDKKWKFAGSEQKILYVSDIKEDLVKQDILERRVKFYE